MSSQEQIKKTYVPGKITRFNIVLYSLSTCEFCQRARSYLVNRELAYSYIHLDLIPREDRQALKRDLKEKYGPISLLPFLTWDENSSISGFNPEKWDTLF